MHNSHMLKIAGVAYGLEYEVFKNLPAGEPLRTRSAGWHQKRRRKLARQFTARKRR